MPSLIRNASGDRPLPPTAAAARRERTVSNEGANTGTKSILKSTSETAGGTSSAATAVAEGPPAPLSASYSRLLSSAPRLRAGRFRQYSMDASLSSTVPPPSGARAVKFFLESEGSEPPTPEILSGRSANPSVGEEKPSPIKSGSPSEANSPQRFLSPKPGSPPFRRTSLPAQSNTNRQGLYLQSQVNSARGMLMDLLASNDRRELPPNVTACLRAVTALLNTAPGGPQQNGSAGGISTALSLAEFGIPPVLESPYSGEVQVSATSKPRVSNITFSTVTSATGLPTIAAEPSRPRSSSYWKPSASTLAHSGNSNSGTAIPNNHQNHTATTNGGGRRSAAFEDKNATAAADEAKVGAGKDNNDTAAQSQLLKGPAETGKVVAAAHLQVGQAPSPPSGKTTVAGGIRAAGIGQKLHKGAETKRIEEEVEGAAQQMTGQPKSGAFQKSPSPVAQNQQQQLAEQPKVPPRPLPSAAGRALSPLGENKKSQPAPLLEEECCSEQSSSSNGPDDSLAPALYKTVNGTTFDRADLERDPALRQIQEWSFPIFHFAEKHRRTVLSRLTYAIFKEADLFRTFKISYAKFFNYFHALESGYWDIPYHNKIHAADVLHGCYYLTCHPVHAFCGYHSEMDDEEEEQEGGRLAELEMSPTVGINHCGEESEEADAVDNDEHQQHNHHQHSPGANFDGAASAALPLAQSMSALELMALYTAAAMHDYDHPGRTNAFLVASEDRKAILYNDRSVLENHHAAESWRLLSSQSQNHFIENLDSAETKRFRYLVLEYILATDLKQHFDIICQFNERAQDMDLANESDRVLVSLMLIKFADINSPAKPYALHRQWTERICQEFYEQGDEEKLRHMAISPYMDRNEPAVAKLQDSFIAHIVNPLAVALNEAGLLPILPGLPESELIINLKHNHQKWLQQIELEQRQRDKQQPLSIRDSSDEPMEEENNNETTTPTNNGIKSASIDQQNNCSAMASPTRSKKGLAASIARQQRAGSATPVQSAIANSTNVRRGSSPRNAVKSLDSTTAPKSISAAKTTGILSAGTTRTAPSASPQTSANSPRSAATKSSG